MRSPKLAALELRRFGRGKLPRAALVALLLLPLLYGALYLWSFWDPYGRLDRIPVALVNDDNGRPRPPARRSRRATSITKGLRDSKTFDWHEVSADEAREGVEDGTYYLSLTMPSDFSKRIASSSGDSPETSALQVRTNDANNYIVGQISRTVFCRGADGRVHQGVARLPRQDLRLVLRHPRHRPRRPPRAPTSSRAASARPRRAPRTSPTA